MRLKKLILCLFFCGVFAASGNSMSETKNKHVFRFKDPVVVLEGLMTTRLEFGPPGFGEDPAHDAKEKIFILKLDYLVDVIGDPGDPDHMNTDNFFKVREMQMVLDSKNTKENKKCLGKKVKVTGNLFQRHTGHHHTDVLIDVSNIETLKETKR
jgi:hypothetical protein